ncbi:MAG: amidohydrolase family protein [Actinomycetota bacterium]|nr:amidohydrolase family protein [Actinomycetota bacterium]MDQ2955761.1 amidohydrolase family protein [Actinomycetota bacterium]
MDAANSVVTALAVRHGQIVAVGEDRDIAQLHGPRTRIVDLAGRTVIPGINDSHLHATWLGALWPRTLLGGGDWAVPSQLVADAFQRRAAILRAGELCLSMGITSYTEPGLGAGEDAGPTGCFGQPVLDEYLLLAAEGLLQCRVTVLRLFGLLDGPSTMADFVAGLATDPPETDARWLNIRGVKIFADGIPPMRSAWMHACYSDGSSGELLVAGSDDLDRQATLRAMIGQAHALGLQIGVHATGDRTIDVVVDALAEVAAQDGQRLRHYLVHADTASPAAIARMAQHGIGVTTQPGIALATSQLMSAEIGAAATGRAWPLAQLLAAPLTFTLSSDAPVLSPDWRSQIAAAAAWMGRCGTDPELMLRLLHCYTTAAAVQDGAESWKGSIEVGKVADLCVLAGNPLTIDLEQLPELAVDATILDGQLVFQREHAELASR